MEAVGNVGLGTRSVNIYRFTGQVIDSQRSSETSFMSHSNHQVTSQTHHYNEIFIRSPDGEERVAEVGSTGVPVRAGNTVTVVWGIIGNREKGLYAGVYNHDTRQMGYVAKAVNDLAGPHLYNMMIIIFVFVGVFAVGSVLSGGMSGVLPLLLTGGFFFWLLQRRKKLRAAMAAAVPDLSVTA